MGEFYNLKKIFIIISQGNIEIKLNIKLGHSEVFILLELIDFLVPKLASPNAAYSLHSLN